MHENIILYIYILCESKLQIYNSPKLLYFQILLQKQVGFSIIKIHLHFKGILSLKEVNGTISGQ